MPKQHVLPPRKGAKDHLRDPGDLLLLFVDLVSPLLSAIGARIARFFSRSFGRSKGDKYPKQTKASRHWVRMNNAGLYERANFLQRRDTETILGELAGQLRWPQGADELVLDVGCGAGDVTKEVLAPTVEKWNAAASSSSSGGASGICVKTGAGGGAGKNNNSNKGPTAAKRKGSTTVVGVDVSNDMIRHARERYGGDSVSFSHLDVGREIPDRRTTRKFSKVFSFYCLHWVREQAVALRNLHRLLEPGGELVLVFLARNPIFDVYRRMARNPDWADVMKDVESFVPQQQDETDPAGNFRAKLLCAGFEVARCEARALSYAFDNANHLAAALRAVNPFVGRLDVGDGSQARYMADLMREAAKSGNSGGKGNKTSAVATANYTLLVVHARKPEVQQQHQQQQQIQSQQQDVIMTE